MFEKDHLLQKTQHDKRKKTFIKYLFLKSIINKSFSSENKTVPFTFRFFFYYLFEKTFKIDLG